jgi:uncharacterized membrane protein YjjP (DUF1212 family)
VVLSTPTPAPSNPRPSLDTPLPVSERTRRRTAEELSDYVSQLGELLLRYGCPAYRVEGLIRVVADSEGHEAEAFALPTGLFVTVAPRGSGRVAPVHRMVRVTQWGIDLDKLLLVDEIFNEVASGRRTVEAARAALADLETRRGVYSAPSIWLAAALTSGGAAVLFRGSALDVALAAGVGVVLTGLGALLAKHPQARFLLDFVGALVAALLAALAARFAGGSREAILLAGMIMLFPGMTLTTGLAELAQKNLVAGAARLMEAAVTFVALVFGIALSIAATTWLGLEPGASSARVPLPLPVQALAAVAISVSLGVVFNVPRKLLWAAFVSGAAGYAATALAGPSLPPYVAAFVAATSVCGLANLLARSTGRPAQLYHLPGMMLLVPGSLGFLSLDDLLRGTYDKGVEKGLLTLLIAGGLVMGVLLANVLFPPKKLL